MHPVLYKYMKSLKNVAHNLYEVKYIGEIYEGIVHTMYSKTLLYCPSIHRQTRVSPRISAVPFSICSNNPVKMPNSHTAIRHGN
jgi:hypothetical protein